MILLLCGSTRSHSYSTTIFKLQAKQEKRDIAKHSKWFTIVFVHGCEMIYVYF